jgi:hypothetical protein
LVERPGFQKLVASVCSGLTSAVFCHRGNPVSLGTAATGIT